MGGELRCTRVARALGYRPAGTAGSSAAFVLVEAPLPWPSDVGSHPFLAPLASVVGGAGGRLQAVVPPAGADPGTTTVVVLRRAPVGFDRAERTVPNDDVAPALAALLADRPAPGERTPLASQGQVRDLLVCTHGSRDVCCGADGMRLYGELVARDLPGVRLWRTSHTGGHRFAPTALTFPDGRAWAWLDPDLVQGIVERSVPADVAAAHDRGSTALADPFAQAAESAVFRVEGWGWLDRSHRVDVGGTDPDHRIVTVAGVGDRDSVAYRVEVARRGTVPVPDCGHPLDEARKSSPDLEVTSVTRIRP
jgi:hypothetical protein